MVIVKSCCCFDLRTGGLILGWLGIVSIVLQLFVPNSNSSHYLNFPNAKYIFGIVGILMSACLLYGIYAKKSTWILLHIVLSAVVVGVVSIIGIIDVFTGTHSQNSDDAAIIIIILLVVWGISIGIYVYLTFVLYSLFKQIKSDK